MNVDETLCEAAKDVHFKLLGFHQCSVALKRTQCTDICGIEAKTLLFW